MTNHLSGKVLVVDDEPANVEVVARLVKRLGCDVVTAADGRAALDAVQREQPDLVLLDVNMPRLNGFDVCRSIKRDPLTRLLPVVLITGLTASDLRIRGIEAGADNVLSKPFVPRALYRGGFLLCAQIVAVVDAYDAMTTERPYKSALQPREAFEELWQDVRKGWKDASLVTSFVSMMTARSMLNTEIPQ